MKRTLALLLTLTFCCGCGTTAIRQAIYTAKGPQGSFLVISANVAGLSRYRALEIAHFANNLPDSVPNYLVDAVQDNAVSEMSRSGYFGSVKAVPTIAEGKSDVPTLVLRGIIIDITSDRIPGEKLISSGNHLIAVVEVVDKQTGAVLAKANVRGEVKSVVDTGETSLAEGMARGVKKLFARLLRRAED
jgi:hypothetical protein